MGPNVDQIEVVIAGPNIGESCVVHIGGNQWVIVDSCRNVKTRRPFALDYLYEIGVPYDNVKWIIATHWHDDHIDGMCDLLKECVNARFAISAAFTFDEFLEYAAIMAGQRLVSSGTGTTELMAVFSYMTAVGRPIARAAADKRLDAISADEFDHGRPFEIWTLSPSDDQCDRFLREIVALTPVAGVEQYVARPQGPNNVSSVVLITFGEAAILLGADLEEVGDEFRGWQAILGSLGRPNVKSTIFKVPHHGAPNGYHRDVWQILLEDNPIAVITPYGGGRTKRPDEADVRRTLSHTNRLFVTRKPGRQPPIPPRDRIIEKTIKESTVRLRLLDLHAGYVRIRNGGIDNFDGWSVELFGDAHDAGAAA